MSTRALIETLRGEWIPINVEVLATPNESSRKHRINMALASGTRSPLDVKMKFPVSSSEHIGIRKEVTCHKPKSRPSTASTALTMSRNASRAPSRNRTPSPTRPLSPGTESLPGNDPISDLIAISPYSSTFFTGSAGPVVNVLEVHSSSPTLPILPTLGLGLGPLLHQTPHSISRSQTPRTGRSTDFKHSILDRKVSARADGATPRYSLWTTSRISQTDEAEISRNKFQHADDGPYRQLLLHKSNEVRSQTSNPFLLKNEKRLKQQQLINEKQQRQWQERQRDQWKLHQKLKHHLDASRQHEHQQLKQSWEQKLKRVQHHNGEYIQELEAVAAVPVELENYDSTTGILQLPVTVEMDDINGSRKSPIPSVLTDVTRYQSPPHPSPQQISVQVSPSPILRPTSPDMSVSSQNSPVNPQRVYSANGLLSRTTSVRPASPGKQVLMHTNSTLNEDFLLTTEPTQDFMRPYFTTGHYKPALPLRQNSERILEHPRDRNKRVLQKEYLGVLERTMSQNQKLLEREMGPVRFLDHKQTSLLDQQKIQIKAERDFQSNRMKYHSFRSNLPYEETLNFDADRVVYGKQSGSVSGKGSRSIKQ
jgi:hypothetical protein